MSEYRHGAYGDITQAGDRASDKARSVPIYVGTALVHTVADGAATLNEPILVSNFTEAARRFGYSDDWVNFTLCEAMHVHFRVRGVGPILMINTLDPEKVKAAGEPASATVTPANGRATISNASRIVLPSVVITGKVCGTDYTIAYDHKTEKIQIMQANVGSLGTEALQITYHTIDPTMLDVADVIGASDGEGTNTGIYAVRDVYEKTGCIPALLACPGFSDLPEVHQAMAEVCEKANGHWDAVLYTELPILATGGVQMTMSGAVTWKSANGYNLPNEKTFFPMVAGLDGRTYHLSVLAAASRQQMELAASGIPYQSPSNTELAGMKHLYFGSGATLSIDDQVINEKLCKYGITSAAYVGGRWVIWGPHAAAYQYEAEETSSNIHLFDTNVAMLRYISNDFQHRRALAVDKPMSLNRLKQIVAEEQAKLDALVATGALTYGKVVLSDGEDALSDMARGDFKFAFEISTMPLAKSLTALVTWTDQGIQTYFIGGV